jgi:hypothetical protein
MLRAASRPLCRPPDLKLSQLFIDTISGSAMRAVKPRPPFLVGLAGKLPTANYRLTLPISPEILSAFNQCSHTDKFISCFTLSYLNWSTGGAVEYAAVKVRSRFCGGVA